jgi:hypothetical protein
MVFNIFLNAVLFYSNLNNNRSHYQHGKEDRELLSFQGKSKYFLFLLFVGSSCSMNSTATELWYNKELLICIENSSF